MKKNVLNTLFRVVSKEIDFVQNRLKMKETNGESTVSKKIAFETISKFLTKEWSLTSESDLAITPLKGGYVNTLYTVENNAISGNKNEPKKVILRFYGGKAMGDDKREVSTIFPFTSEVEEILVFQHQSMTGCGSKLYGIFSGGLVQEYVESHTLGHDEAGRPEIIQDLAKTYAKFHLHDLPFDRTKKELLFNMHPCKEEIFRNPIITETGVDLTGLLSLLRDREKEMEFVKKILSTVETKEVLLHFDCQFLNVLVRNEASPKTGLKTVLIDYEICLYGPRIMDLGGHFCARMMDAAGEKSMVSGHDYPPEDQRRLFLRKYLQEIQRLDPNNFDPKIDNEEHLMLESEVGSLVWCFLLTNGSFPLAEKLLKNPILFSYMGHLSDYYIRKKPQVIKSYPQLFS